MTDFRITCFVLVSLLCISRTSIGQNIALGEWRIHASYNDIQKITFDSEHIYGAAANGVVIVNRSDKSFQTLNKANALTRTGITTIAADPASNQLIIAYDDGTFDVIHDKSVKNFDPSLNTVLTGPKSIHAITIQGQEAYLSTDYGVLIFDLQRSEIKETWRDLGTGGGTLSINDCTFRDDSVFLATASGIIAGDLNDNLLDFNKWRRFSTGELAAPILHVENFANAIYATLDGSGIFKYTGTEWAKLDLLQGKTYSSLSSSDNGLIISESSNVWTMVSDDQVSLLNDPLWTNINEATRDADGKLWVGDHLNGLVTDAFGSSESILPGGPSSNQSFELAYHDKKVYLLSGGYDRNGIAYEREGKISFFDNGEWTTLGVPAEDLSSIAFDEQGRTFVGSFGYGVIEQYENNTTIYDDSNSPLVNSAPPERQVNISALAYSPDGLWVANYGVTSSLHVLKDQAWQSFSFPVNASRFPTKLLVDFEQNVWALLNAEKGGGILVYDKTDNEHFYKTEADGGGELPSNRVYSIALDRDGYVWAGTDAGVAYFFDKGEDAIKPIFENRFLLRDDKVTAIAVDGGNRKWMGTERGVWLFSPDGESSIANYTQANSPLLSDKIIDIEIDPRTGEVFFATDKGTVSFRSDATETTNVSDNIKIFPNPVLNNFSGLVGMEGLPTDAVIKITDVSGRLVFQTVANGGSASWDVRDHQGRRVSTGVFLVFAVRPDGSETVIGKIAVVN